MLHLLIKLKRPLVTVTLPHCLLQIFAAVAEFERNLISERTKVGLDNARKRNKLLGRPKGSKIETIEKYHYAKHLYGNQGVSIDLACKRAKIGKTSFYRVEKELSSKSSS